MRSVSTPNPHPPLPQLWHPWHQTLCCAECVLLERWHLPGLPLIHQPERLADPSSALFVCFFVGIKPEKLYYSASCWRGRHPHVFFLFFWIFLFQNHFSWSQWADWERLTEGWVRSGASGPLKGRAYWYFLSFFFSWVSKTQPNHWTKRMANTQLAT